MAAPSRLPRPLPWLLSLLLHGLCAAGVMMLPPRAHPPAPPSFIQLTQRELPPPPPAPPAAEPLAAAPQPRLAMRRTLPPARPQAAPEEPPAAPARRPPQPAAAPSEPPSFGLELSGTAVAPAGEGVQVPAGETLHADPRAPRKPREQRPAGTPSPSGFKQHYSPGEQAPLAVVTTMPKVSKKIEPAYPEEIKELGIEGRVLVEVTIDGHGHVVEAKVLQSLHPVLDAAALRAARATLFSPATVNGVPVSTPLTLTYTFVLD